MLEDSTKSKEYLETAFKAAVEGSRPSIEAVANYLKRQGFKVEIPEIVVRDKLENRHKFEDNGDLFYWKDGVKLRVEIKHHKTMPDFTGYGDHKYNTVLIGRKHLIQKNIHLVHRYVSVSQNLRYATVVNPDTRHQWRLEEKFKHNWGTMEWDYYCPVLLSKIIRLAEE